MADIVLPTVRSRMMSGIRGKDTRPEIAVRKFLHAAGLRFRLHVADLPGRPDIVLPKYGSVVFVHGCFWHRHDGCKYSTIPKTSPEFWNAKFMANVQRDKRDQDMLRRAGWNVVVIWECEASTDAKLNRLLARIARN
jgi:DNA mismatch endonuclease, patch repair protein